MCRLNGTVYFSALFLLDVMDSKWLFYTITKRCWFFNKYKLFFLCVIAATPQFFMEKSIINRASPVPAMWLSWTITKCCFYEYSFPMRLRANTIFFSANTIMAYRIIYILLWLKEQKLILLAFPSNIANTIVKSLNIFYSVRA